MKFVLRIATALVLELPTVLFTTNDAVDASNYRLLLLRTFANN
jgi:hypothetical protein